MNALGFEPSYFELQAYMGTTKHMGGQVSTRELVALCQITPDARVLDVGCGAGATASYLARQIGCRVVAVDLYGAMIALAQERTARKGVGDRVTFHVADVRNLPFANARFDTVLCESVLTFVAGKGRAIGELVRVVRPGGYVGLNEEVWFRTPPDEMVEFAKLAWGIETEILPPDGWRQRLEAVGLQDVVARIHDMDVRRESSQIARYDLGDLWNMFHRIVSLYVGDSALRRYIQKRRRLPRRFFQYLGYGIYAGRR